MNHPSVDDVIMFYLAVQSYCPPVFYLNYTESHDLMSCMKEGYGPLVMIQDLIVEAFISLKHYILYSFYFSRTLQWDTDPSALQLLADSVHG